jgi:putative salt-induced outer membrane protein YdiY
MNSKLYSRVCFVTVHVLAGFACSAFGQAQDPALQKEPTWETSAALGFTLQRGNTKTLLFTGNIQTTKKTPKHEWNFGADATYGENDDEKNAENMRGYGQYNHLFTERFFGYLRGEVFHDDIADIDYRITIGPGAGYYFIKEKNMSLRAEAGPAFVHEKTGDGTDDYLTVRLAERFDWKFNDRAKIWQSLEVLPQVDDFDNYLLNAEAGLETSITPKLSLRTYVQDTYDNEPAPDRQKNDVKFVTALAYKF